jgi:hypothetical protein
MADSAMELNDKNSDGVLDQQELAAAPGLRAAAEAEPDPADSNKDGKLSRDEVRDRIAHYQDTATGLTNVPLEIYKGKTPVAGATVELLPEPFLEGVLDVATGTTRENGFVIPTIVGEAAEGIRPGMYRIKVNNEDTSKGIEVSRPREGYTSPGPARIDLNSK